MLIYKWTKISRKMERVEASNINLMYIIDKEVLQKIMFVKNIL